MPATNLLFLPNLTGDRSGRQRSTVSYNWNSPEKKLTQEPLPPSPYTVPITRPLVAGISSLCSAKLDRAVVGSISLSLVCEICQPRATFTRLTAGQSTVAFPRRC